MSNMRRVEYMVGTSKTVSYKEAMEISTKSGLPIVTMLTKIEPKKPALAPQAKKRLGLI